MAGIAEIEELVNNALSILPVARRAGADGWELSGNTVTIKDSDLLAAIRTVLERTNAVELEREVRDLSPFEAMRLARHTIECLPRALNA